MPAVAAFFKCQQVLDSEDSSLLRDEDVGQIQVAQDQAQKYQEMLDILEPLRYGLTARKLQAQGTLAEFCGRIYKNGASAINRNRILVVGMKPLMDYVAGPAVAAEDTKHLKAQVAHDTEAQTLDRVKTYQQGTSAGTGGAAAGTGTVGIPLQGAHAPGQTPVAPGAMPVAPSLPAAQHAKPKRRSSSGTASKKKAKPAPPKS